MNGTRVNHQLYKSRILPHHASYADADAEDGRGNRDAIGCEQGTSVT